MNLSQVQECLWANYESLIKYAAENSSYVKKYDINIVDIVHEAIISLVDSELSFESTEVLMKTVKKSIETISFHETRIVKTKISYTEEDEDNYLDPRKLITMERATDLYAFPDDLNQMFEMFYNSRFYKHKRIDCHKCGSASTWKMDCVTKTTLAKCRICSAHISITAGTYLDNTKLSYYKWYKLIKTACECDNISSYQLAKLLKIRQPTAWSRYRLVKSIIFETGNDPVEVLKKLLSVTVNRFIILENMPVKKYITLSPDQILDALNTSITRKMAAIKINRCDRQLTTYMTKCGISKKGKGQYYQKQIN